MEVRAISGRVNVPYDLAICEASVAWELRRHAIEISGAKELAPSVR